MLIQLSFNLAGIKYACLRNVTPLDVCLQLDITISNAEIRHSRSKILRVKNFIISLALVKYFKLGTSQALPILQNLDEGAGAQFFEREAG